MASDASSAPKQEFPRDLGFLETYTIGVGIRTQALVGHSVGDAVLDVIEEERASHVVLGWTG